MIEAAPLPGDYRALYRRAFDAFGAVALWNKALFAEPSPEHALVIARALAEALEKAAKQALSAAAL